MSTAGAGRGHSWSSQAHTRLTQYSIVRSGRGQWRSWPHWPQENNGQWSPSLPMSYC